MANLEANLLARAQRPDAIAPNRCTSAIGYTMTGLKQIKTVLENEQDACSIE